MDELAKEVKEILIVAASARGLVESAALAGFRVHAVDAYGDVDLLARASTIAVRRDLGQAWSAAQAVAAAASIPCRTVAYASNLENHPGALARLAAGRRLWGNAPEVLRRVRDPVLLAEALRARGFATPRVSTARGSTGGSRTWLLKPRRSGGGHGIRPLRPGEGVPRTRYLQERIEGVPGSVTFVADGRRAVPLGLSLQLVGWHAFGGTGFRYSGSLLCGGAVQLFERQPSLADTAAAVADALTETFGLVGVNGIDFIARDGVPWVVEVNPRYCASMELVERAHGISIFGLHVDACGGRLPTQTPFGQPVGQVYGKGIVYARGPVIAERLEPAQSMAIRDVPHPAERIGRGRPICTVFAEAKNAAACLAGLEARAAWVYSAGTRADRSAA
jgi:predicted ATP-grasp superfamily ATP-dependent carboligase